MAHKLIEEIEESEKRFFSLNFLHSELQQNNPELYAYEKLTKELDNKIISSTYNNNNFSSEVFYKSISTPINFLNTRKLFIEII